MAGEGGDSVSIAPEFFIERQGRKMVLFAGLLSEAHERGLQSIDTELLQVPGQDNGEVAIVKAVVVMEGGARFSGIGDAGPHNVGKMIQAHTIRMAETRAKARALRDAVNIGVTAFEEMGGDEDTSRPPASPQNQSSRGSGQTDAPERTPGGASRKSAGLLWIKVGGKDGADEWQAENGQIDQMSQRQVSAHLDELS